MSRCDDRTGWRVFEFSFREHSWFDAVADADDFIARLERVVAEGEWADAGATDPARAEHFCDPDVRTLDELEARAKAELLEEFAVPDEIAAVPFAKLRTLVNRAGWRFVSGSFFTFEGNHNDTEFSVVLAPGTLPAGARE